jgi:hypothetical protein
MIRWLLLLSTIGYCLTATANPRAYLKVGPRVYLYSERVVVSLSPHDARVTAAFTFRFEPDKRRLLKANVTMVQVPIWLPNDAPDDVSLAAFWQIFGSESLHTLTETNRDTFLRALAFTARVGGQDLDVAHALTYSTHLRVSERQHFERWPTKHDVLRFADEGFGCVIVGVPCKPLLLRGDTPLMVSYRQPHAGVAGYRRFVYLPSFYHQPQELSVSDRSRYSITLEAASGCRVQVTKGVEQYSLNPGENIVLTPVHHEEITATIDCGSTQSVEATQPRPEASHDQ